MHSRGRLLENKIRSFVEMFLTENKLRPASASLTFSTFPPGGRLYIRKTSYAPHQSLLATASPQGEAFIKGNHLKFQTV